MAEQDNDFGEVIMGNSPFAEYLKDLQKNSEIDVDVDPILSQILPPPPPPPLPPPTPTHFLPSPPPPHPPPSLSQPLQEGTSIEKIKRNMYHKMYNCVVGSELLHPEESIFLCEDEGNSENSLQLKPEIDTLLESDQVPNWMIIKNQAVSRLQLHKQIGVFISIPILALFMALQRPLVGFGFVIFLGAASFLLATFGYYFFVQYVLKCQSQLENKVHESIEFSKKHDANLLKVMKSIQEVELIARGYRLSTPLSPIERLEQNAKSKKSLHMRAKTETSIAQSRRILRENSSKFLGFLPLELSSVFGAKITNQGNEHVGELTLAELKAAFYQNFIERSRFYTLVLLSFCSVTHQPETHSFWKQYKDIVAWQNVTGRAVAGWLLHLQTDIVELKTCISTEFWANQIPQRVLLNKTQRTVHERFLQQSKDLKLLLQGIIARAALCEENIHKTNANDKEADDESKTALAELVEQYQIIRRDLAQSLDLWDSGNILLLKLIDSLSKGPEDAQFKELRNLVKDGPLAEVTEEPITPVALELIRNEPDENEEEQLFEAYTGPLLSDSESEEEQPPKPPPPVSFIPGAPPPPPPMGLKFVSKKKPKKSRAERLAEKEDKKKTAQSIVLPELEAKKVITELKDVLKIRKPPKQT